MKPKAVTLRRAASADVSAANARIAEADHYTLACFYSVSGDGVRALDHLEAALSANEVRTSWARTDGDFDYLRLEAPPGQRWWFDQLIGDSPSFFT